MKTLEIIRVRQRANRLCAYKISYIIVVHCPGVTNLVPKYAQIHFFNLVIKYLKYLIIVYMNFNEIIRAEKKL